MQIYIHVADLDELDTAEALSKDLAAWVEQQSGKLTLAGGTGEPEEGSDRLAGALGVTLKTRKKQDLKQPLEFLFALAKTYKTNFVVGVLDPQTGPEDVCFFGQDEGRPDVDEVGSYLGL